MLRNCRIRFTVSEVKCIRFKGIKLWFFSNDHNPPHFHAKKRGEWEYRVNFLEAENAMLEIKWGEKEMPKAFRKILVGTVAKYRAPLLMEWEAKVCRDETL